MAAKSGTRIDIAINERGTEVVVRKVHQVAAAFARISPAMARKIRGQALRVGLSTDRLVKEVSKATLQRVVETTPRDTGGARANWQVAINKTTPPKNAMFQTYDYEGQSTIDKGHAFIEATKRQPGQTVWISNALPYIEALNQGWSQQAPAGFVELGVQHGRAVGADPSRRRVR